MIDEKTWSVIVEILSVIDHSRRPNDPNTDALGHIHVILFGERAYLGGGLSCPHVHARIGSDACPGDFKQLPPATGRALRILAATIGPKVLVGAALGTNRPKAMRRSFESTPSTTAFPF